MDHKKDVNRQLGLGFALLVVLCIVLWFLIPDHDPGNRVEYTLSWLAVLSIPLFLGIHPTLFKRYKDADLIQGYAAKADVQFERAYLSNTVEQTAVNFLTMVTLGMVVPLGLIKLVPMQATIFVIARILYYVGYRSNPMRRFTGFVTGYYLALGSLALSAYFVTIGDM